MSALGFPEAFVPPPRFLVVRKAVLVDDVLVGGSRGVPLIDALVSFRGIGESLRIGAEEGARGCRRISAEKGPSVPGGWGDGAGETLAAAAALRIWART